MDRSGQTRSFLSIEVKNKITLNKENEAGNKLNLLTALQIIILQRSSWLAIQTLINQRLTNLAILAEVRRKTPKSSCTNFGVFSHSHFSILEFYTGFRHLVFNTNRIV